MSKKYVTEYLLNKNMNTKRIVYLLGTEKISVLEYLKYVNCHFLYSDIKQLITGYKKSREDFDYFMPIWKKHEFLVYRYIIDNPTNQIIPIYIQQDIFLNTLLKSEHISLNNFLEWDYVTAEMYEKIRYLDNIYLNTSKISISENFKFTDDTLAELKKDCSVYSLSNNPSITWEQIINNLDIDWVYDTINRRIPITEEKIKFLLDNGVDLGNQLYNLRVDLSEDFLEKYKTQIPKNFKKVG